MIEWLKIKNLALVQDAEIDFSRGFNVITGETGAGKTVIISAISLLFGARASKTVLRTGESRCELASGLSISKEQYPRIKQFLYDNCIPELQDNSLLIRRIVTESSGRCFINDTGVSVEQLSRLGDIMIDFHGPSDNQSIMKPNVQLEFLDSYGNLDALKDMCRGIFKKIRESDEKIKSLSEKLPDQPEAEYLKKLVAEIETANLLENEDEQINTSFRLASGSRDILKIVSEAKQAAYEGETSVFSILTQINRILAALDKFDRNKAARFAESVNSLILNTKELASEMDSYASSIDLDEYELARIEDRLNTIASLKKKYGPTLANVFVNLESAKQKLSLLSNFEHEKLNLEKILKEQWIQYRKIADELSAGRKKASDSFIKETKNKLKKLGFLKSEIYISFTKTEPASTGTDNIEILFSANPGEQAAPLKNVASSGEVSRIMLAIKTVLSTADSTPVLVFDEIDSNIGGETASRVGEELRMLGRKHQVLCISHLPQVASFGEAHYLVTKHVSDGRTFAEINPLTDSEKTNEISRMLGGGDAAKKHAEEILKSVEREK